MGDVITIEGLYDVDVTSTRNLPIPGGKHGGVMGLFFYSMICDPGTFYADYSCRQGVCIPVSKGKGDFKDLNTCQAALGSQKCTAPPAPPDAKYKCQNDVCTPGGTVDLAICEAACG